MGRTASVLIFIGVLNSLSSASQSLCKPVNDSSQYGREIKLLPRNFYTQRLTFFCKKELDLQKIRPGGIYFRLGSKEYVDALEEKPNSKLWSIH
ncbi:MAG: hypothetical protein ACM3VS_00555 [Candidatus Dadabacteria bacterium]